NWRNRPTRWAPFWATTTTSPSWPRSCTRRPTAFRTAPRPTGSRPSSSGAGRSCRPSRGTSAAGCTRRSRRSSPAASRATGTPGARRAIPPPGSETPRLLLLALLLLMLEREDVEDAQVGVGAVERLDAAQVVLLDVVEELLAVV